MILAFFGKSCFTSFYDKAKLHKGRYKSIASLNALLDDVLSRLMQKANLLLFWSLGLNRHELWIKGSFANGDSIIDVIFLF